MTNSKNYLAFDFGASNGRAIIGKFDGQKLKLEEIHRFENRPVFMGNTFYWDFLRLFSELKIGLKKACGRFNLSGMGVDTFGCDFGLVDGAGNLISNPVHYRDKRTTGMIEEVSRLLSPEEIYRRTGTQTMEINSIYQIYSMRLSDSPILKNADCLLMLGDLFNYYLTGNRVCEFTGATTFQALDQENKVWDYYILGKLKIPKEIFLPVTEPGTVIGSLTKSMAEELEIKRVPVALSAYDTSAEISSIPLAKEDSQKNWAYLCCGTWAMIGTLNKKPIISDLGLRYGFGNEGGVGGYHHLLKNMLGLWIIQQCMVKWKAEGSTLNWSNIIEFTEESADNNIFIDIDDQALEKEIFNMPRRVVELCRSPKNVVPKTMGQVSRCVYESLVMKTYFNIKKLEEVTGRVVELVHMVGGGSRNRLLCQWVCDALGVPVIAPAETTATGNILVQMLATGDIDGIEQGREVVKKSVKLRYYNPKEKDKWDYKKEIYSNLFNIKG